MFRCETRKVAIELVAKLRTNRLGMELDAVVRSRLVSQPHDDAASSLRVAISVGLRRAHLAPVAAVGCGPRRRLETIGQRRAVDHQRVVPNDRELFPVDVSRRSRRDPLEKTPPTALLPSDPTGGIRTGVATATVRRCSRSSSSSLPPALVVFDDVEPAVHGHRRADDLPPVHRCQRLMTQAHAQYRRVHGSTKQRGAYPYVFGTMRITGSGGEDDACEMTRLDGRGDLRGHPRGHHRQAARRVREATREVTVDRPKRWSR